MRGSWSTSWNEICNSDCSCMFALVAWSRLRWLIRGFFLNLMASRVICQRIIVKAKLGKSRLKDNILLQHWLWKQHYGLTGDMMMVTTMKMSTITPLLLIIGMLQSGQWKTMTGQFSFARAVFQWDLYLTGRQFSSPVFQLDIYICPSVKLVLCPAQYSFYMYFCWYKAGYRNIWQCLMHGHW